MNATTKRTLGALAAALSMMMGPAFNAQAALDKVASGIAHQALFSTNFDGDRGIAVGAGGEIQMTSDGGKTWKPEAGPTRLSLTTGAVNGSKRVIAGLMGEIFFDDGSGKWAKAETGLKDRAFGSSLNAAGVAMVVGSFGMMLRSEDGKNWKSVAPTWLEIYAGSDQLTEDFAPSIYAVTMDAKGHGIAVGELSTILRTEDAGLTWQVSLGGAVKEADRPPALFGVTKREDGMSYAVGQSGLILQSPDHGKTWCSIVSGTDSNLLGVASLPGGKTLISGIRAMLLSTDDGKSWNKLSGLDLHVAWYGGAATATDGAFIAAGQSGNILRITQ